uniref:Uncharacterized protein n=1 Tax=Tanacetum cinerariifolium TaxID=118510 RepID=A0A6L2J7E0_TANCI|nr:hypothetical protein [Tanacetum cinerariifolium]
MKIRDTMINDAFKKSARYKYYKAKKAESEKAKPAKEPEEQHVSPVKSRQGKGYMRSGDQEANFPSLFKKNDVSRKTRSLIVADNIVEEQANVELAKSLSIEEQRHQQHAIMTQLTIDRQIKKDVEDTYAEWGQKLKGLEVKDTCIQSLLDLRKGSKASRLESLKQMKQATAGEGSSAAHNKYYEFENISAIDSDAHEVLYVQTPMKKKMLKLLILTIIIWTYLMIIHKEMMLQDLECSCITSLQNHSNLHISV